MYRNNGKIQSVMGSQWNLNWALRILGCHIGTKLFSYIFIVFWKQLSVERRLKRTHFVYNNCLKSQIIPCRFWSTIHEIFDGHALKLMTSLAVSWRNIYKSITRRYNPGKFVSCRGRRSDGNRSASTWNQSVSLFL